MAESSTAEIKPQSTDATVGAPADAKAPAPKPASRVGGLIAKYPTFVSSFVIGIAGLVATSIWQYRQQQTQRSQAEAAQKVAETQAANSWKIERTEVLGKNLDVLAQTGANTADQRYGVLLSLTRAEIIDPELAESYALELGRDNTEYMQSVLANTPHKDYGRLVRAFTLSCEERYGTSPPIDACTDKLEARSTALGELFATEVDAALSAGPGSDPGPLVTLRDERRSQLDVQQLTGLFETSLLGMYDRRQWDTLAKFEQFSPGAHLVASLVLAAAHTGDFVSDDEAKTLSQFHASQTKWLADYLLSPACDAECKGRLVEVMVSHYEEAQGDFDRVLRALLESPHAQSSTAIARLHARILWCQVDDADLEPLRDQVLVPAVADLLKPGADASIRDAVLGLLALVPEPGDADADAAWKAVVAPLDKLGPVGKKFRERRAMAAHQRAQPPPSSRKVNFCAVPPPAADPTAPPPAP